MAFACCCCSIRREQTKRMDEFRHQQVPMKARSSAAQPLVKRPIRLADGEVTFGVDFSSSEKCVVFGCGRFRKKEWPGTQAFL